MTSHLNSHRTTDIKPEMLSGVQTGDGTPHDWYNIHGIAHTPTKRKDNIFMQRRLAQSFIYIGVGARDLYIDEAHPALDILHIVVFFVVKIGLHSAQWKISPSLKKSNCHHLDTEK